MHQQRNSYRNHVTNQPVRPPAARNRKHVPARPRPPASPLRHRLRAAGCKVEFTWESNCLEGEEEEEDCRRRCHR